MVIRDENRRFDTTDLRIPDPTLHRRVEIHRDYIAHCFRWSYAARTLTRGAKILDIGCGRRFPLLSSVRGMRQWVNHLPSLYCGIDLNLKKYKGPHSNKLLEVRLIDGSFIDHPELVGDEDWDFITNFEMIEHMRKPDGLKLLTNIHQVAKKKTTILLSTPCFNGRAALNHIHEWEREELKEAIEGAGFKITKVFGTFASYTVIKKVMKPEHLAFMEELKKYYDKEILSTIMAPLYPEASRNNIWQFQLA